MYIEYKTRYYKLNSRAKILIKPVLEYTYIKGYELTLKYKIKNKLIKKYIWINVNTININNNIDVNSNDFKDKLKYLLNRKKIEKY